jgi:cysteine synthase A/cysteine synthase B
MTTTLQDPSQLEANRDLRRFDDIRQLLPSFENPSPLLQLRRVVLPAAGLYLKLEWLNPFGSIKDRAASYLLEGLRARGELTADLVEASSGNTGLALAALANLEGIKVTVTVPEGVPEEKKTLLRMLGAEVWETPDDLCPVDLPKDGAIALARSLANSPGSKFAWPDQYSNPDNVRAHYETTGPEIWRQTEGKVRNVLAGLGTTGTITGVGRFLKEQDPLIQVIGIEPEPGHRLPGLKSFGEATEPAIFDRSVIDRVVVVSDRAAYDMTKRLFREEGLMVGPSTGAVVEAAVGLGVEGPAVAISADSGLKYASFFKDFLGSKGEPTL